MKNQNPDQKEILIYGTSAVDTLWDIRREDIIRAYCLPSLTKRYAPLLKWCATHKKAYHVVDAEALSNVTKATHHQGIALMVKAKPIWSEDEFIRYLDQHADEMGPLLYLDGVDNSHNLGAIQRTHAHFGGKFILGEVGALPEPSGSWIRLSSGGYEFIDLVVVKDGLRLFDRLRSRDFDVIALSQRSSDSLYFASLPKKSVMVFGNEVSGISERVLGAVSHHMTIPGTSLVESLNVSVAVAVCVSEWSRRHS